MSEFKIQMPKLGESVQEATITKLFVKEGDRVEEDMPLFEVASEKVDSEIPSPVEGTVKEILYQEGALVAVGTVVLVISVGEIESDSKENKEQIEEVPEGKAIEEKEQESEKPIFNSDRFYSPLVKSIATAENINVEELDNIPGSGTNGRVQKADILKYIESKRKGEEKVKQVVEPTEKKEKKVASEEHTKITQPIGSSDQIIEMDRVRRLIADHMVMSKNVSAHVTSVVEADVTDLVLWREKIKDSFLNKYGEKITFMPLFIEAAAKAILDYPLINSSVEGTNIILKKEINIGIAVAKPDGNLVVPVVKNADQKNLLGLCKDSNRLSALARVNQLVPEDYQAGTFTITNFGSFRNLIGTPIINQPQVAILATGSIEKKPAVIETPMGDSIAIRHRMFLSLSFDHRIIDGALGGAFLRRIADILENFDTNREL